MRSQSTRAILARKLQIAAAISVVFAGCSVLPEIQVSPAAASSGFRLEEIQTVKEIIREVASRQGFREIEPDPGEMCRFEAQTKEFFQTTIVHIGASRLGHRIVLGIGERRDTRLGILTTRRLLEALEARFGTDRVKNTTTVLANPI